MGDPYAMVNPNKKTAMERIKEIETYMETPNLQYYAPSRLEMGFMLKAFKLMREIAIRRGEGDQSYREDEIVNEEFEERMKE